MAAFVAFDLFQLVASSECTRRGLGKGSLFMSAQTTRNLQLVALSTIVVTASKDEWGDPYRRGGARMCEISIEQFFGRLRVQSPSAQLSTRAYWAASARDMARTARKSKTNLAEPPNLEHSPPLTAAEFHGASERALQSALALVAWCSDLSTQSLEDKYKEWCLNPRHSDFGADLDAEDAWDVDAGDEEDGVEDECQKLLRSIEEEAGRDLGM